MKKAMLKTRNFLPFVAGLMLVLCSGCLSNDQPASPSGTMTTKNAPPPPPQPVSGKAALVQNPGPGEDSVFSFVEQMPSFPGGERALMQYLSANIRYPAVARENSVQGTVVIQFDVEKDGTLSHLAMVYPASPSSEKSALASEAIRVIKNMPAWNPGEQKGHRVVVRYSLPVRFVLQ